MHDTTPATLPVRRPAFGCLTGSPGTRRNDACRDGIGWSSEATHDALETCLRCAIRPLHVSAGKARLRRVARIDQHDWHPNTRRFVLHERSELGECPIGVARSLPPANRSPVADAREVFQGNPAPGVFGGAHQSLADAVVRVGLEARLLPSQRLQFPFGRACPAALEIAATVYEGASLPFDLLAGVDGGVGVYSNVDDSQIDAEIVLHIARRNIGHVERSVQVEHSVPKDEISLATQPLVASLLIATKAARHQLPTFQG